MYFNKSFFAELSGVWHLTEWINCKKYDSFANVGVKNI